MADQQLYDPPMQWTEPAGIGIPPGLSHAGVYFKYTLRLLPSAYCCFARRWSPDE
jgi:hypothetical protein